MRSIHGPGTLLAVFLGGCDLIAPVACTTDVRPAFEVTVVDAQSGVPLAEGATVTVREGGFSETLRVCLRGEGGTALTFCGVGERAGTYAVVVEHPGYDAWSRSGVRVTKGECHVRTQRLTAELVATGGGNRAMAAGAMGAGGRRGSG